MNASHSEAESITQRSSNMNGDMARRQAAGSVTASHTQGASVTVKRSAPKVGRNDPCPCGSGKKYKQCCGRNA